MAFRQFEYADPLTILMNRESKTCRGCIHELKEKAFGIIVIYCAKNQKKMQRCKLYQEKE